MTGRKVELPKYDQSHLTNMLNRIWLSQGPFKHYVRESLGWNKDQQLELYRGKVFSRIYGVDQIIYFGPAKEKLEQYFFYVNTIGVDDEWRQKIETAIDIRLKTQNSKKNLLRDTFGDPKIVISGVEYRDYVYNGANVSVPILKLPRGREGNVSENFFADIYTAFVWPSWLIGLQIKKNSEMPWRQLVEARSWDDFSSKKATWREHLIN